MLRFCGAFWQRQLSLWLFPQDIIVICTMDEPAQLHLHIIVCLRERSALVLGEGINLKIKKNVGTAMDLNPRSKERNVSINGGPCRLSSSGCCRIVPGVNLPVRELARSFIYFSGPHPSHTRSIHPSGRMALSVSRDRTLRLWNLLEGRCAYIKRLQGEGELVRWSSTGDR